jgi:hypothetical protein
LRNVHFDSTEKPSRWENLTDILEILAVLEGLKPSHLNGHGLRSGRLLDTLESIAGNHGLLTLRTPPHPPHHHREPNVEKEFLGWLNEREAREATQSEPVLWVYRDASVEQKIRGLIAGGRDETEVLGYPSCCVQARSEIGTQLTEALVQGYKEQHHATTGADLIRCSERDAEVRLERTIATTDEDSQRMFPFVQFSACEECIQRADSPAGQLNRAMEGIAEEIDTRFAVQIRQAARGELSPPARTRTLDTLARAIESGRGPQAQEPAGRPRRNDRCPCGSGLKYKKCCGRPQ